MPNECAAQWVYGENPEQDMAKEEKKDVLMFNLKCQMHTSSILTVQTEEGTCVRSTQQTLNRMKL